MIMSKQCLDVQQMQHLQELGLKLDYNTRLSWIIDERGKDKPLLCLSIDAIDYVDFSHCCIPAYTLQDVLDALPCAIGWKDLILEKTAFGWKVMYRECDCIPTIEYENRDLIDAACEMLVWCIKQGYVETNKNG